MKFPAAIAGLLLIVSTWVCGVMIAFYGMSPQPTFVPWAYWFAAPPVACAAWVAGSLILYALKDKP